MDSAINIKTNFLTVEVLASNRGRCPPFLMVSPESTLRLLGLAVTQNVFSPTAASRRRRFLCATGIPLCIRPGANWLPEIDNGEAAGALTSGAGRPHAVAAGRSRQSRGQSGSRCTTAAYGALCSPSDVHGTHWST